MTGSSTIEQGKQFIGAPDVDYVAGPPHVGDFAAGQDIRGRGRVPRPAGDVATCRRSPRRPGLWRNPRPSGGVAADRELDGRAGTEWRRTA
jgi:hypothetical protein